MIDTVWIEHRAMIEEAVQIKHNFGLEPTRSRAREGLAFLLKSKVTGWYIDWGAEPIGGDSPGTDGVGLGNLPP